MSQTTFKVSDTIRDLNGNTDVIKPMESPVRFHHEWKKVYSMVNPSNRNEIIEKINRKELISQTITGKTLRWWLEKHHPNNDIPTNIYLLGKGTIEVLHKKYIKNHGNIEWSDFIDHTRELIKQKIMI